MANYNLSSKEGQKLFKKAANIDGECLNDIYYYISSLKVQAFSDYTMEFLSTDRRSNFHIYSHNKVTFSVCWNGYIDNEPVLIMRGENHTNIVYLNK